jgi:PTH1 family peptidyl-tRNA hydrolase
VTLLIGHEAIRINDGRATLAFANIAAEAEWLTDGDDARFMSEVALRMQDD